MVTFINHDQLKRSLLLLWKAKIPACIIGGVGSGKTTAVEELCNNINSQMEDNFNLWKVFLGLVDATEIGGMPYRDDNDKLNYMPPNCLPFNTDEAGIIFGDEYDRAPSDVQNAFNQILLGGEIHGNKISKNSYVVLAMNGESDQYTTPLSEAARNRVCTLFLSSHAYGNLEQWNKWAHDNNINDTIRAFANCRTDLIQKHEEFSELALLTPRSRDMAGRILDAAETINNFETKDIILPCLAGVIGNGPANELLAFQAMKEELPDIDHMLNNPNEYEDHEVFYRNDLTYMLSVNIASYCSRNKEKCGDAITLMSKAPAEIQAFAVDNIIKAEPNAVTTREYKKFFDKNKHLLI
nr:ATPase associated with various cellular activities AAA_3 [uncultured Mediterranean phage uvMED]